MLMYASLEQLFSTILNVNPNFYDNLTLENISNFLNEIVSIMYAELFDIFL